VKPLAGERSAATPVADAETAPSNAAAAKDSGNPAAKDSVDGGGGAVPAAASASARIKSGRYVCPYCQHACAKPSVLEKHIRAHTNERPYPCVPCGFAFKTKSNLYKHCKSRTHVLKVNRRRPPSDWNPFQARLTFQVEFFLFDSLPRIADEQKRNGS